MRMREFRFCRAAVFAFTFAFSIPVLAQEFTYRKELSAMIEVTKMGIQDRRWLDLEAGPIFNFNVDWHSSVAAHWALLRTARVLPEHRADAEWVEARLTPENLKAEETRLAAWTKEFDGYGLYEFHGKAWFLLLAIEFERWATETHARDPKRLRGFADRLAVELIRTFHGGIYRKSCLYGGGLGDQCWAITRLYEYMVFTGNEAEAKETLNVIDTFYAPEKFHTFRQDNSSYNGAGFYSAYGNQIYMFAQSHSALKLDEFLTEREFEKDDLSLIPARDWAGSWRAGYLWGCAWAFKAIADRSLSSERRARAQAAFQARIAAGMEDLRFKGDWMYSYWVGPFGVFALTEGARKP